MDLAYTLRVPLSILDMDAGLLLSQVFNGLVLGMLFVLVALGLSIIFGMLGLINFAHGDMLLVGTYVGWSVADLSGSFVLALVAAPLAVGAVGYFFERLALRRIYDENVLIQVLLTFGLAEFLRAGVEFLWGPSTHQFPTPSWGQGSIDLVLFTYPAFRLFVIVFAAVLILGLHLLLTRTNVGMIIRAGTQDREMVDTLGIDISRVYLLVFMLGAGLAGIAGALIGPVRNAYPMLGIELMIPAFVVIVIGGIGSFKGTVIAGILVGQVTVLTGLIFPPASEVIIFVLMGVIILLRPRGLFGREGVFE